MPVRKRDLLSIDEKRGKTWHEHTYTECGSSRHLCISRAFSAASDLASVTWFLMLCSSASRWCSIAPVSSPPEASACDSSSWTALVALGRSRCGAGEAGVGDSRFWAGEEETGRDEGALIRLGEALDREG